METIRTGLMKLLWLIIWPFVSSIIWVFLITYPFIDTLQASAYRLVFIFLTPIFFIITLLIMRREIGRNPERWGV